MSTPSALTASRLLHVALATAIFACLYVPFAAKPVHIDDANFLMLAEGAARDPWRPHNIQINWSGKSEPAFDILANPPGIAWYLAPVRRAPEWILHLWMLPWLGLGAWGCWTLGRQHVGGNGLWPALYLLTSPVVVISSHALTPDLPLFACMAAGIAGFGLGGRTRPLFALLAGSSALFRYSGGTAIPLLVFLGWRRHGWRGALAGAFAAVPVLLLVLHDLHAYGRVHILTMVASQNDADYKSIYDSMHNWVAGTAMLGGAVVLPVLVWRRESIIGAIAGAIVGFEAAYLSGQSVTQAIPTILAVSAGCAALSLAFVRSIAAPFLSLWAIGGSLFFLTTRFAATRYWGAFLPGIGLLAFRNAAHSRTWVILGVAVNVVMSFAIAFDDQALARAHRDAAIRVAAYGTGSFSGHWGWQHYLEREGWKPLERGGHPEDLHVFAGRSDAQHPAPSECLILLERFEMPDSWPGPRVYSWFGRAFYHAGGRGSYAPWSFSDEPYEVISVYRRCESDAASGEAGSQPTSTRSD